jgi:hypothetical protein
MIARLSELLKDQPADADYANRWLKWAEGHANLRDPFSEGLKKFFDHYESDNWFTSRTR